MATQTHFISQIQKEEKNAVSMLKKLETENDKKVTKTVEESANTVREAEEKAREQGRGKLLKTKEEAKGEYKKIIIDSDNARNDVVAGGKKNLDKAQKHITKAFVGLFE
jgi:vacuolar-type H+-ATPase subunit H